MMNQGADTSIWEMLSQLGLPAPQELLGELRRLNVNLEQLSPDINRLVAAGPALSDLARALQSWSPEDLRQLTRALEALSQIQPTMRPMLDLIQKIQK